MGDGCRVGSAGHVDGTRGTGIVSSAADVLWMRVVRVMRGVGVVCDMCLARGIMGVEDWVLDVVVCHDQVRCQIIQSP